LVKRRRAETEQPFSANHMINEDYFTKKAKEIKVPRSKDELRIFLRRAKINDKES